MTEPGESANPAASDRGEDNVIRFPRDWIGPLEDLVPMEPRLSRGSVNTPPLRPTMSLLDPQDSLHDDPHDSLPPLAAEQLAASAEDFWGETAEILHQPWETPRRAPAHQPAEAHAVPFSGHRWGSRAGGHRAVGQTRQRGASSTSGWSGQPRALIAAAVVLVAAFAAALPELRPAAPPTAQPGATSSYSQSTPATAAVETTTGTASATTQTPPAEVAGKKVGTHATKTHVRAHSANPTIDSDPVTTRINSLGSSNTGIGPPATSPDASELQQQDQASVPSVSSPTTVYPATPGTAVQAAAVRGGLSGAQTQQTTATTLPN